MSYLNNYDNASEVSLTHELLEFSSLDIQSQNVYLCLKPKWVDNNNNLFVIDDTHDNTDVSNITTLGPRTIKTHSISTEHIQSHDSNVMSINNAVFHNNGNIQCSTIHLTSTQDFSQLSNEEVIQKQHLYEYTSNTFYDKTHLESNYVTNDSFPNFISTYQLQSIGEVNNAIESYVGGPPFDYNTFVTNTSFPNLLETYNIPNRTEVESQIQSFITGGYDFSQYVTFVDYNALFNQNVTTQQLINSIQLNQLETNLQSDIDQLQTNIETNIKSNITSIQSDLSNLQTDILINVNSSIDVLQNDLNNVEHTMSILQSNIIDLENRNVDLSNYYTKHEVTQLIVEASIDGNSGTSNILDLFQTELSTRYTKEEANTTFYTKEQVDDELGSKLSIENANVIFYSKLQSDARYVMDSELSSTLASYGFLNTTQVTSMISGATISVDNEVQQYINSTYAPSGGIATVSYVSNAISQNSNDISDSISQYINDDLIHGGHLLGKLRNYIGSTTLLDDYLRLNPVIQTLQNAVMFTASTDEFENYYTKDELFDDVHAIVPAWLLQNDYIKKTEIETLINATNTGDNQGVSHSDMESFVLTSLFNLNATLSISGNVTPEWLQQNEYMKSHEITPLVLDLIRTQGSGNVTLPYLQENYVSQEMWFNWLDVQQMSDIDTKIVDKLSNYVHEDQLQSYITTQELENKEYLTLSNAQDMFVNSNVIHENIVTFDVLESSVLDIIQSNVDTNQNTFSVYKYGTDHLVHPVHCTNITSDVVEWISEENDTYQFRFNNTSMTLDQATVRSGNYVMLRDLPQGSMQGMYLINHIDSPTSIIQCTRQSILDQSLMYVRATDEYGVGFTMGGSMFKAQIENNITHFIQLTNTQFGSLAYQDSSNITISGGNISVPHIKVEHINSVHSDITMHLKDEFSTFQIKSTDIEYGTSQTVFQVDGEGTASCFQFFTMSDRSLKTNIQPIQNAVDLVHQLQGKTFDWNDESRNTNGPSYGFIAQEVQEHFPSLVHETIQNKLAVDYSKVVAVLVEAVKELAGYSSTNLPRSFEPVSTNPEPAQVNIVSIGGSNENVILANVTSSYYDDFTINELFSSSNTYTLYTNQGANTLDGVALQNQHIVLIKDADNPVYNGVYVVENVISSHMGLFSYCKRYATFQTFDDMHNTLVVTQEGTQHQHKSFLCLLPSTTDTFVLDNTDIQFIGYGQSKLRDMAKQNANDVNITGGDISISHLHTSNVHAIHSNIEMNIANDGVFEIKNQHTTDTVFSVDGQGIASAHDFYQPSDRSLKKNIHPIQNALDLVCNLHGKTFDWIDYSKNTSNAPNYGFIAQEVKEQFPSLVHQRVDGTLAVDYSKVVSILVEAVKELQNKLNS